MTRGSRGTGTAAEHARRPTSRRNRDTAAAAVHAYRRTRRRSCDTGAALARARRPTLHRSHDTPSSVLADRCRIRPCSHTALQGAPPHAGAPGGAVLPVLGLQQLEARGPQGAHVQVAQREVDVPPHSRQ